MSRRPRGPELVIDVPLPPVVTANGTEVPVIGSVRQPLTGMDVCTAIRRLAAHVPTSGTWYVDPGNQPG